MREVNIYEAKKIRVHETLFTFPPTPTGNAKAGGEACLPTFIGPILTIAIPAILS